MAKTKLISKKETKKPLTIRLDSAIRAKVKKFAKDNDTTETRVVETGLDLFFQAVKNEQKVS